MPKSFSSDPYFVGLNVLGFGLFTLFASLLWAPHGDEGLLGGPGDPIIRGILVFPVLLVCGLMNVFWLRAIALRHRSNGLLGPLILWCVIGGAWAGLLRYDASRQYNGSAIYPQTTPQARTPEAKP